MGDSLLPRRRGGGGPLRATRRFPFRNQLHLAACGFHDSILLPPPHSISERARRHWSEKLARNRPRLTATQSQSGVRSCRCLFPSWKKASCTTFERRHAGADVRKSDSSLEAAGQKRG